MAFDAYSRRHPSELSGQQVRELLVESGLWTGLRARPYGKVPPVDAVPSSIFVTAADSNPLSPSVDVVMRGNEEHFTRGVVALARIAESAPVYVCKAQGGAIPEVQGTNVRVEEFSGRTRAERRACISTCWIRWIEASRLGMWTTRTQSR